MLYQVFRHFRLIYLVDNPTEGGGEKMDFMFIRGGRGGNLITRMDYLYQIKVSIKYCTFLDHFKYVNYTLYNRGDHSLTSLQYCSFIGIWVGVSRFITRLVQRCNNSMWATSKWLGPCIYIFYLFMVDCVEKRDRKIFCQCSHLSWAALYFLTIPFHDMILL